ncbi:creatinase [Desulforamulus reducens MI-1]|uniref:Creatinase n=1 Tax=Desulforamulus reducens (strain ATCC BAA-1160 / DSM 100696 / MI-1) TaxID=349161 RepID=A4J5D7_DESRM|nr:Xaa-Pro peptidase family protein [Desulforamulus reducens]ABO50290.1 creatinase [Desulforamulus reducens MI-1]
MQMKLTPKSEIDVRISRLQEKLRELTLDGTLILLNSDMFYFSGTVQTSYLYVPVSGDPVLMIKKSLQRGRNESPLKNIVSLESPKEIPAILSTFGYVRFNKIGLELDVLPVNLYKRYQKIFHNSQFLDISPVIKDIRAIKSPYEIELLRDALSVIDQAHRAVPTFLREGMLEIELAALFEAEMRKRGYSGCCKMRAFNQDLFLGNTCTGNSASTPSFFDGPVGGTGVSVTHPHGAGWKKVCRNEVVYIDYTCVVHGYTGDQTRIFCIGELNQQMEKAFDAALLIQSEIIKAIKPGTPAEEPYLMAVKLAEEMGYKDHFMGYMKDKVRFIGHGIGLELDEFPILAKGLKTPILPGMTFALEPKFVFSEGAIGIENSFVMTEKGPEYLSVTPNAITYIE